MWRLYGAIATLLVTMLCFVLLLWGGQGGIAQAALVMLGAGSLSMAVAMLLSARREEQVHQLASDLHEQALLTHEAQEAAYDGTVG